MQHTNLFGNADGGGGDREQDVRCIEDDRGNLFLGSPSSSSLDEYGP